MPCYTDAIGYLAELAKDIGEPWFNMICDLAVVRGVNKLSQQDLESLFRLYFKKETYTGLQHGPAVGTPTVVLAHNNSLLEISAFVHFKGIRNTLKLVFSKHLTIIFGRNGSGKSSICEALKVLASVESPTRPLKNVKASVPGTPAFSFQFQ